MKKISKRGQLVVYLFIGFIFLIVIGAILFGLDIAQKKAAEAASGNKNSSSNSNSEESCVQLGCPEGTKYVGSINSDKYYTCDCRFAKQINEENIACFSSDEDAQSLDYTKSDC